MLRDRLAPLAAAALALGALSACGSDTAPRDASAKEFCIAHDSLQESIDTDDPANLPGAREQARILREWAARMQEVGTPSDIPAEARQGYELALDRLGDIETDEVTPEAVDQLDQDLTTTEREQATAYGAYVIKTCGPAGTATTLDPASPDLPGLPETTE